MSEQHITGEETSPYFGPSSRTSSGGALLPLVALGAAGAYLATRPSSAPSASPYTLPYQITAPPNYQNQPAIQVPQVLPTHVSAGRMIDQTRIGDSWAVVGAETHAQKEHALKEHDAHLRRERLARERRHHHTHPRKDQAMSPDQQFDHARKLLIKHHKGDKDAVASVQQIVYGAQTGEPRSQKAMQMLQAAHAAMTNQVASGESLGAYFAQRNAEKAQQQGGRFEDGGQRRWDTSGPRRYGFTVHFPSTAFRDDTTNHGELDAPGDAAAEDTVRRYVHGDAAIRDYPARQFVAVLLRDGEEIRKWQGNRPYDGAQWQIQESSP